MTRYELHPQSGGFQKSLLVGAEEERIREMDRLINSYNAGYEAFLNEESGIKIADILMEDPWLQAAVSNVKTGLVVEVGPYKGINLAVMADRFHTALADALVLGVDRGDYKSRPGPEGAFELAQARDLFEADRNDVLNRSWQPVDTGVFKHRDSPNTFAVYQTTLQEVLRPDVPIDLLFLQCMMGYLLKDASLAELQRKVFPRARQVYMIDYVGACDYTGVVIPQPQTVAATLSGMDVSYRVGENHFVLYGRRPIQPMPQIYP